MKQGTRKNPHAVALGRLGGRVRSAAKQRANRENGRKGDLSKVGRRLSPLDATHGVPDRDGGRSCGQAIALIRARDGEAAIGRGDHRMRYHCHP